MTLLALLLLAATPSALPDELAFMQGCWAGETGHEFLEEQYGGTHAGTILGHVKISEDGELKFFEFLMIYADTDGTWLQPYPEGRDRAPRYALIELEADKAIFENPQYGFPRRITYRLLPNGQLLTQIVGTRGDAAVVEEYSTSPRPCAL